LGRIGDKRRQTLKTAGSGKSGLHQRQEWEIEITGDTPKIIGVRVKLI